MSADRKKAVWPLIVALLIGLSVLYVASIGPAEWLYWKVIPFKFSKAAARTIDLVYWPIIEAQEKGIFAAEIGWYKSLWGGPSPPEY